MPDDIRDAVAGRLAEAIGATVASLMWSLVWVAVAVARLLWRRGIVVKL